MEFLSVFCNWHLRRYWKKRQSWKGFVFVVLDEVSFLDHQFLVANPFHQLAHVLNDFFVDNNSTCVERLQATFLLVIHIISMLEVMELALLMNVS